MSRTLLFRLRSFGVAALAILTSVAVPAQVVFGTDDLVTTNGNGNVFPFSQPATGYTTLNVVTAAQIHAAGVAPGATLLDLAVVATSAGTFSVPQAQILVGHLLFDGTALADQWAVNLDNPAIVHDPTFGIYTFPYATNAWAPVPGVAAAGFFWDGVRDVGVYISVAPGVTGGVAARRTSTNFRYGLAAYLPTNQTPAVATLTATKFRVTFSGSVPTFNTPQATLTLSGTGSAATLDGGDALTVAVSSTTAPNASFLLLLSSSLTGGHLPFTGQSVDLGFPAAGFSDVFLISGAGFTPANAGVINFFGALNGAGASAFSVPLPCGLALPRSYAQVVILDPTHPDGLRVSGAPSFSVKQSCRYPFAGVFPTTIPDTNTAVAFTVTVPPGTSIADVDLVLELSHPNYTDLTIVLDLNGVLAVSLKDATTVDTSDLNGRFRFSDEGAATLDAAALVSAGFVYPGTYAGDNPLSVFDGSDAGGVWTLIVADAVPGTTGSVLGASLILNGLQ